ncbi:hypothetical protein ACL07V_33235 [Streptomyces sp. MB22_4]|uniref:hypothetical protein n=1 Tax=Streptomyces sp. MB22_4 TaxID=3383120 RepID=UPI0039A1C000
MNLPGEEDEFEVRADPVRRTIPQFEQLVEVVGLVDIRYLLLYSSTPRLTD